MLRDGAGEQNARTSTSPLDAEVSAAPRKKGAVSARVDREIVSIGVD
jgi:hypothetical protein